MWYDKNVIKYPLNSETGTPSLEDLRKIMEEIPEYRYIAICDYLSEAIRRGEAIDIEQLENKYYSHPVDTCTQKHYLTSYYFLAYYYFKNDLYPLKAMDYIHMALQEKASYDSASALLVKFYMYGFGVKQSEKKAKEIWLRARKEIESWPHRYKIHYLSVFNMEF